jgi:hypothetical protein
MGKDYKRLDALERILAKRTENKRQSSADKCKQIIDSWKTEGLTKEVLEVIKNLPINQELTKYYQRRKIDNG